MAAKLRAAGYVGPYRLRKQLVEPVFGQIKQARGFRQFPRRGLAAVQSERSLICTVHNLLKLAAALDHPKRYARHYEDGLLVTRVPWMARYLEALERCRRGRLS